HVRVIRQAPDGVVYAEVQGSRLYSVELEVVGDDLAVSCECPWLRDHLEDCKHIWAAIRAASARRMLPDRELMLTVDVDDDDYDEPVYRYPRPVPIHDQRPRWQRFLDALE